MMNIQVTNGGNEIAMQTKNLLAMTDFFGFGLAITASVIVSEKI